MTRQDLQTEYEQLMNSPVFKEDERTGSAALMQSLIDTEEMQRLFELTDRVRLNRILKLKGWL